MPHSKQKLRQQIIRAAQGRCEYCLTLQEMTMATFHLDHIIPRSKGGTTAFENLCLSCPFCNEFKSEQWQARDPITKRIVRLFNPRRDRWSKHFQWSEDGTQIIGLSTSGRATIDVLRMNNQIAQTARRFWVANGIHPPKSNVK
jgi:hypothetical protein